MKVRKKIKKSSFKEKKIKLPNNENFEKNKNEVVKWYEYC